MEIDDEPETSTSYPTSEIKLKSDKINSSIKTSKFIRSYFSCRECSEVRTSPSFLKCDHVYCDNCLFRNSMKQKDGSIICPFCLVKTSPNEMIPKNEIKNLLQYLNSINDEEFETKFLAGMNFYFENRKRDCDNSSVNFNLIKLLLNLIGVQKNTNKSSNYKKRTYNETSGPRVDSIDNFCCNDNVFKKKKRQKFI